MCKYTYLHAHSHTCIYTRLHTHTFTYIHMNTHIPIGPLTHMYLYALIWMHIYLCAHKHTCIYIHTNTHCTYNLMSTQNVWAAEGIRWGGQLQKNDCIFLWFAYFLPQTLLSQISLNLISLNLHELLENSEMFICGLGNHYWTL